VGEEEGGERRARAVIKKMLVQGARLLPSIVSEKPSGSMVREKGDTGVKGGVGGKGGSRGKAGYHGEGALISAHLSDLSEL